MDAQIDAVLSASVLHPVQVCVEHVEIEEQLRRIERVKWLADE